MKILQITPSLVNGGAERFVVDLSNELQKQGHSITLVSLQNADSSTLEKEVDVAKVFLGKKPGFDILCFVRLARFVCRGEWDIIHTHTRALNYLSIICLLQRKKHFFHTMHNDAAKEDSSRIFRFRKRLIFWTRLVHPITISQDSQRSFDSYYQVKSDLVPNGTRNLSPSHSIESVREKIVALKESEDQKVFVNVARITKQKNQELLFELFARPSMQNSLLLILGRHSEPDYLQSIIDRKPQNVHLMGSVSNVQDFLFCSDAFILSSLWEGMPISIIEAFATGCVPISTPAGGVINMIDDKTGFVSKSFTVDDLEAQVAKFLKSSSQSISRLREQGLRQFKNCYSISSCARQYVKLFAHKVSHP